MGNGGDASGLYTLLVRQQLLLNTLVDESGSAPLTLVVNWQAGLSDKVWSSSFVWSSTFRLSPFERNKLKLELRTQPEG